MSWEYFILFAVVALVCWSLGAFAAWKGKKTVWAYGFTLLGLAVFFCFILGMWVSLERPPMRTMGETRLWYSFFLPLAGLITYIRWKYKWILSFSCVLSLVFSDPYLIICFDLMSFSIAISLSLYSGLFNIGNILSIEK